MKLSILKVTGLFYFAASMLYADTIVNECGKKF